MTDRELMQFLFEVLDNHVEDPRCENLIEKSCKLLRDRLAQPEPEPVAWHEPGAYGNVTTHKDWALANEWEPLYAAPREWVGLTDDEIKEIVGPWGETPIKGYTRKLFDQIEAKLKEKNT